MNSSSSQTAPARGFYQPPEWHPQKAVWLAWPSHPDLWEENYDGAQKAILELATVIHEGQAKVKMLVPAAEKQEEARARLSRRNINVEFHLIPFGDIWLRDTAPLFMKHADGTGATFRFQFNGWGNKYLFKEDPFVGERIAKVTGYQQFQSNFVCEGGAIEIDGEGTAIVTEECLLNRNRNSNTDRRSASQFLRNHLGIEQIIWLKKGLANDHTDGHVDNIARFVRPGVVLCMEPLVKGDPNKAVLQEIIKQLKKSKDARGKKLEIITIPSPGETRDKDGSILAASYLNFLITNNLVAAPLFETSTDEPVMYRLERAFPDKKIVGINCQDLLTGGGALHCVSQPEFS